jgi:hypothetical protein
MTARRATVTLSRAALTATATVATMAAFSAVNLSHWLGAAWWVWLWPTIVGVQAIAIWTTYYKKKFSPKPRIAVA